jgi:hypothetical protein
MKKKTALVILAFILLGSLLRFGCVAVSSAGGGRGAESPDKKFLALASEIGEHGICGKCVRVD